MVITELQKTVLKRLFLVGLFLSAVAGTVVFFIELKGVDDFVVSQATAESETIKNDYTSHLDSGSSDEEDLESLLLSHLPDSHFAIIELYDKDRKRLAEVVDPKYSHIEDSIDDDGHVGKFQDTIQYVKGYYGRQIYLQLFSPLTGDGGEVIAYVEGIYVVDEETMSSIINQIGLSVLQVVVAILITSLTLYPIIISINKGIINASVELSKANLGILTVLGGVIAKRDSDTYGHNYRVALYSIRLGEATGMSGEELGPLIKGAFLHDVGKVAISDTILLKPGKLTGEEMDTMKTHVVHGVDIVKRYKGLDDGADVVRYHHEKYDGTGYMEGLKGKDIPINARIFAIVDVFDALTSERPYKQPFSYDAAIAILAEGRGKHYDPDLLDTFELISKNLYNSVYKASISALEEELNRTISSVLKAG